MFQAELEELAEAERRSKLNDFLKIEKNIVSNQISASKGLDFSLFVIYFIKWNYTNHNGRFYSLERKNDSPSVSNMTEGRDKNLPSFWIPSKTPEVKIKKLEKPVSFFFIF